MLFFQLETIVGVNKHRLAHEDEVEVLVVDNTRVREQQVTAIYVTNIFYIIFWIDMMSTSVTGVDHIGVS